MKARVVLMVVVMAGVSAPATAGCFGGLPPGFLGCGQRLGLGPGYPGLFPPTRFCPAWFCPPWYGPNWMPDRTVVVVPSPPVQVYIASEQTTPRTADAAVDLPVSRPATVSNDELARVRRLYPRGVPAVEYVWSPGQAVLKLRNGTERR